MPRPSEQSTPAGPARATRQPKALAGRARSRQALADAAARRRGQRPPNFGKTYPIEVLSDAELGRLLAACPRTGPIGARNRALIAVMWRCGLRVAETVALLPKDVDFERGTLTVLRGKGSKRRTVGVDEQTAHLVKVWLGVRTALAIGDEKALFCVVMEPTRGDHMRPQRVNELVAKLGRRARVEKRVHPHGFRHTGAFALAEEGMPVHHIRVALGHASARQTERYINHLAPIRVVHEMRDRVWPAGVTVTAGMP